MRTRPAQLSRRAAALLPKTVGIAQSALRQRSGRDHHDGFATGLMLRATAGLRPTGTASCMATLRQVLRSCQRRAERTGQTAPMLRALAVN
jgi:hypothetical protein